MEVRAFGDVHREGQPRLPIDHTWLTVTLKEASSGITGSWIYKKDLFEASNQRHWIADYKMILTKVAVNPETPVGQLVDRTLSNKSGAGLRRSSRKYL